MNKKFRCPDHPKATILKSWNEDVYVIQDGAGIRGSSLAPIRKYDYRYECSVCGRKFDEEGEGE